LTSWWTSLSTTGTDLQILDQELGLMDIISYSAAWQLGRTLAIADQAFTVAIVEVRKQILDRALNDAQTKALKDHTVYKTRGELLRTLSNSVHRLGQLHETGLLQNSKSMLNRWRRASVKPLELTYHGKDIEPRIGESLDAAALQVGSTPDPKSPTQPSDKPYDEFNTPFSPSWMMVLRWMYDRLFLASIPSHYLITDASHLPPESLRFFKIDKTWTGMLFRTEPSAWPTTSIVTMTRSEQQSRLHSKNSWTLRLPA
jgi:hypothetical protein